MPACAAVGAVAGAQVGFLIGRHGGRALLSRASNRRPKEGAVRAKRLPARYGYPQSTRDRPLHPDAADRAAPGGRWLGVPTRTFTVWQVVSGLLWSHSLVPAGYTLGSSLSHVDDHLLPMAAVIVVLSLLPLPAEARRTRHRPPR